MAGDQDWGQETWFLSVRQRACHVSRTGPLAATDSCRGWPWRELPEVSFSRAFPQLIALTAPSLTHRTFSESPPEGRACLTRGTLAWPVPKEPGERTVKVTIASNGINNN